MKKLASFVALALVSGSLLAQPAHVRPEQRATGTQHPAQVQPVRTPAQAQPHIAPQPKRAHAAPKKASKRQLAASKKRRNSKVSRHAKRKAAPAPVKQAPQRAPHHAY